jgi:ubiquinone/menaquinone biosynthesis C-methylase UbiE
MKSPFCNNQDRMSDLSFKMMSILFKIADFFNPKHNYVEHFDIKKGQTVIDYGCGPGRYIFKASDKVSTTGTIYAVDIHEMAMESVRKIMEKQGLINVIPTLANGYSVDIPDHIADLIYALDMFHMISDPDALLKEFHRLIKPEGKLILESGHQSKSHAREKILRTGLWNIIEENSHFFKCKPIIS